MDIRIEEFIARDVVCTHRTGLYQDMAPDAWQALWSWVRSNGHGENVKRAIGFGMDNPAVTAPEQCRYVACIELHTPAPAEPAAGIEAMTIPGGHYAVYRMVGPYHQMGEKFQELLNATIPEKGLTIDEHRPCLETYINDPGEVAESELLTDICIPIEA